MYVLILEALYDEDEVTRLYIDSHDKALDMIEFFVATEHTWLPYLLTAEQTGPFERDPAELDRVGSFGWKYVHSRVSATALYSGSFLRTLDRKMGR
jgi:hypothetical protein